MALSHSTNGLAEMQRRSIFS
ncbi:hypothetical protein U9421_19590 [Escherichia coli]